MKHKKNSEIVIKNYEWYCKEYGVEKYSEIPTFKDYLGMRKIKVPHGFIHFKY